LACAVETGLDDRDRHRLVVGDLLVRHLGAVSQGEDRTVTWRDSPDRLAHERRIDVRHDRHIAPKCRRAYCFEGLVVGRLGMLLLP
jgi:hypothetical protein